MHRAVLEPLNIARLGTQKYDITHYQPLLFCAESFDEVEDVVGAFFDDASDDSIAKLDAERVTVAAE
jgi:phenylalanine-4-hydroxylase